MRRRHHLLRRAAAPAVALIALAASNAGCARPAVTQLVVQVSTNIPVGTTLVAFSVNARREQGDAASPPIALVNSVNNRFELRDGRIRLPTRLGIIARDDDARTMRVDLTAHLADGTSFIQRARVRLEAGRIVLLEMFLADECRSTAARMACEARSETCGVGGQCIAIDRDALPRLGADGGVIDPTDVARVDVPVSDRVPAADALDALDASSDLDADASEPHDVVDAFDAPLDLDAALLPPRQIAPLSAAYVSSQRPTLRWDTGRPEGVEVELCRDRAMTTGCLAPLVAAAGTASVRPSAPLAEGVWYWSVRARAGGMTGAPGRVWQFRVGARDAPLDVSAGTAMDFHGDGRDDLAFTIPDQSTVELRTGANDLLQTGRSTIRWPADGSSYGAALAGAGDVDGDGFGDLVVGAPRLASPSGGQPGGVIVYRGGRTGVDMLTASPVSAADLVGDLALFGVSVASAGDFNGDGYADIVVGAQRAGRAFVLLGGASGLRAMASMPIAPSAGDPGDFGRAVAGAGDVNGDGYGDVLVASSASAASGRVVLVLGGAAGPTGAPIVLMPSPAHATFGAAIAGVGDVNGDGYSDFAVSAPGEGANGALRVYYGAAAPSPALMTSVLADTTTGVRLGAAVAGVGDLNADGLADLAAGDPNADGGRGRVALFIGRPTMGPTLAARSIGPMGAGSTGFGSAIAGARTNSGPAVLVGAPDVYAGSGQVFAIESLSRIATGPLPLTLLNSPIAGASMILHLGRRVAGAQP